MTGQSIAVVKLETTCCRAILELRFVAPDWAEMGLGVRVACGEVDRDNQPHSALRASHSCWFYIVGYRCVVPQTTLQIIKALENLQLNPQLHQTNTLSTNFKHLIPL